MRKAGLTILALGMVLAAAIPAGAALAAPADGTGFTAKIVAQSGQKISGAVDATGYDIGIYIGPGVHDVNVTGANVTGANDEGILVQDTSDVVIKDSTISGNGLHPHLGSNGKPDLTENKAIVLAGTTDCLVKGNTVEGNLADGGISLLDDGPNHPFAPNTVASSPIPSTGNVITRNLVKDNLNACGIVVAAKNVGGGVYDAVVSTNTVIGYTGGPFVPSVGGIVVAGGASGPVKVMNSIILNNTVTGGLIPGISIHAFGPGTISGTQVIGNVLTHNGAGELSKNATGIEIFAVPHVGIITGTQILSDTISNDVYGVWQAGDTGTHIAHLQTDNVADPVFP